MFDFLTRLFGSSSGLRRAKNALVHQQHDCGWRVLLDAEVIAELDYLRDDQPFHIFQSRIFTDDDEKITYGLRRTAYREPGDRLFFECRYDSIRVPDAEFFVNLHEDGTVSVRDMRVG